MILTLAAYVTNAHADPTIEVCVATEDDGEWFGDGLRIHPFWTQQIKIEVPPIPEGWIEFLHEEAVCFATQHRSSNAPSLLSQLFKYEPKVTRR